MLGLLPYAPTERAVVVVLVARLMYVCAEVLLVLVQEAVPRATPREQDTLRGRA